jgi:lysine 2,3-aminomutase
VILTGGDPLMLSARRIADVTARLTAIDSVQVLRWHTRVPIVDPERVTVDVAEALQSTERAVYLAVHINHPRELTDRVRLALARLANTGIVLLSQTVLLKGVNDDPEVLAALFRSLVSARVKPYYLHHPDLAPGTSHFRLSIEEGQAIVRALRGRVSGLAQPTYVLDIPGGHGKVPIGPSYIDEDGRLVIDPSGGLHAYPDRG